MNGRFPTRGRFFWRQEWCSLCSKHYDHDFDCANCQTGQWTSIYGRKVGHFVYRRWPGLWRWWANRRYFNRRMQWMATVFPNMTGPHRRS